MSSDYGNVKSSKLKFKGEKKKKRKRKEVDTNDGTGPSPQLTDETARHRVWWMVRDILDVKGSILLEHTTSQKYVIALEDASISLGDFREQTEGPQNAEILTALPGSEVNKIAIKTGFDKFLTVGLDGSISGKSDAIGMREQFTVGFENGYQTLKGCNGRYVSINTDDADSGVISCTADEAQDSVKVKLVIRTRGDKSRKVETLAEEEGRGSVREYEVNYVKLYQKFGDKKLRLSSKSTKDLKSARKDGRFHEEMLDRREKMKSDRYCM